MGSRTPHNPPGYAPVQIVPLSKYGTGVKSGFTHARCYFSIGSHGLWLLLVHSVSLLD